MRKFNIFAIFLLAIFLWLNPTKVFGSIFSKTPSTPPSLNSGLIGWWTLDGADVTSTAVIDKSGNGNNGTRNGGTALTTGKIGQAMKFNGASGYVQSGTGLNKTNIGNTPSISFWIRPTGAQSTAGFMQIADTLTSASPWILGQRADLNRLQWYLNGGYNITQAVYDNIWYHIVLTYDGTTWRAYKNGLADGTFVSAVGLNTGAYTWFGNGYNGYFNGNIDDVRIYNRALSASEVQQLYKLGGGKINKSDATRPSLKTNLLGWWTMDGADTTATTTVDKSGNGNNGGRIGTTLLTTGKIGQSLFFDGTSGYITTTDIGALKNAPNVSAFAWIKPTTLGINQTVVSKWDYQTQGTFVLQTGQATGNSLTFFLANSIADSGSGCRIDTGSILTANKWQNVGFTFDGTQAIANRIKIYYNGAVASSSIIFGTCDITSTTIGNATVKIGYFGGTLARNFQGSIDDVRVYNRTLSASDAQQLYKLGGGKINKTDITRPSLKAGLLGWWTLDGADVTAATATDKSGNGKDGTRSGNIVLTAGKIGQAMKFDGTAAAPAVTFPTMTLTDNFTVSFWDKTVAYGRMPFGGVSSLYGYIWEKDATSLQACNDGETKCFLNTYQGAGDYGWKHIVIVVNAAKVSAYKNGVFISSTQFVSPFTITASKFGAAYNAFSYAYNGSIDDVRIYNRPLSAAEVMQLYRMGK